MKVRKIHNTNGGLMLRTFYHIIITPVKLLLTRVSNFLLSSMSDKFCGVAMPTRCAALRSWPSFSLRLRQLSSGVPSTRGRRRRQIPSHLERTVLPLLKFLLYQLAQVHAAFWAQLSSQKPLNR